MFLLDTNVVSELRFVGTARCDGQFAEWAESADHDQLSVCSITTLELEIGVQRLERRDKRQGAVLRKWLSTQVLPAFAGRVYQFDYDASVVCAGFHVPDPRAERDSYIAAIAKVHGLTVVTRNLVDFAPMRVPTFNPWGGRRRP